MPYYSEEIKLMLANGECCATIMATLGLKLLGTEAPILKDAMRALCGGLQCGRLCGALSGASCMLSMLSPAQAGELIPELDRWFYETYGVNNSVDCNAILNGRPSGAVCPALIEKTYLFACELLLEYGYPFPE